MKTFFLLFGGALTLALQNTLKKGFTKKCPLFFSFCSAVAVLLVFLFASGFKLSFDVELLKYALSMGAMCAVSMATLTFALQLGDLSISGLIVSTSLIIPTMYGVIFLHNPVSVFFIMGLCALAVALFLINVNGKKQSVDGENPPEKKKFNVKWLIFILISAISNGISSTLQTVQQTVYNGEKKNELMIIAFAFAAIAILVVSLLTERGKIKDGMKQCLVLGGGSGIVSGFLNLFVMFSLQVSTAAITFPVISGGSLFLTFVIAILFFKEKYTSRQYVGYAIGLLSVILLNL